MSMGRRRGRTGGRVRNSSEGGCLDIFSFSLFLGGGGRWWRVESIRLPHLCGQDLITQRVAGSSKPEPDSQAGRLLLPSQQGKASQQAMSFASQVLTL